LLIGGGAAAASQSAAVPAEHLSMTAALQSAGATSSAMPRSAAEPFGLEASALVTGSLQQKWAGVQRILPGEAAALARCRDNPDACTPAAKRFLAIVQRASARDGWIRIAEINRAINLGIRPVDDLSQYHQQDVWASPLMTFASGAGDCEDVAIAKYVALREIGISADDLRLVIVRDQAASAYHAVAAVRDQDRWLILDNNTLDIREDLSVAGLDPLFVIDAEGVKRAVAAPAPAAPWADASLGGSADAPS
jgi:predicted transglutaminase-like cysteine proteinase